MTSRRFEEMAIKMPDIHRDMLVNSIGLFKIINRLKKLDCLHMHETCTADT